jgi:hypothetical protein
MTSEFKKKKSVCYAIKNAIFIAFLQANEEVKRVLVMQSRMQ